MSETTTTDHWRFTWQLYYYRIEADYADWDRELKKVLKRDVGDEIIVTAIRAMHSDPSSRKVPKMGDLINAVRDIIWGHDDETAPPVDQCDPCRNTGWLMAIPDGHGGHTASTCSCDQSVAVPCICSEGVKWLDRYVRSEIDRRALQAAAKGVMQSLGVEVVAADAPEWWDGN